MFSMSLALVAGSGTLINGIYLSLTSDFAPVSVQGFR